MKRERFQWVNKLMLGGFSVRKFMLAAAISAIVGIVLLIVFVVLAATSSHVQTGMKIYGLALLAELALHLGLGIIFLVQEKHDVAYGLLTGFVVNALFSLDAAIAVLFILGPFIKYL